MDRRRAAGALLALAACIACSAAAPTASNHTALDLYEGAPEGCYYNFQHYGEGDRIMTNEPCLNCTCHNRMLMCYLRVCPFTKAIGQDCTVEKRADQCCPIVTCPDVPVDLLTSTSTTSPAEYGATGLGKLDKYGCSISGKYFPEGSKVPPTPNKPCEHCYCIRNMTTCVMQECTLHVDGCTPIYHKDVCCPVRYSCDHPEDEVPLLDDMSTTVRPTPGFLLTTTTMAPVTQMTQDCVHDDQVFADGALIKTEKACEHCYCMKGDIVCVVQECGAPMENEGKNCTSLPPREGQCCPDTYICDGDELPSDLPTESATDTIVDKPTTLSPPRRTNDEGSGYRNEPDEVTYTEMPVTESEVEGSGDDQETSKPLDPNDMIPGPEDGEQYIYVTTKAPTYEEHELTTAEIDRNVTPASGEQTEQPHIHPSSTITPVGEESDKLTTSSSGLTEEDVSEPHKYASTTSAPETFESITTELGESLNTVPDETAEPQVTKAQDYAPGTTSAPTSVESESLSPVEGGDDKPSTPEEEKDVTATTLLESTKPEYSTPSSGISDDTEKEISTSIDISNVTPEVMTEYSESDISGTTVSSGQEIEKESVPVGDKEFKPELTTSNPLEDEKSTTEVDHAQNTVAVSEEETPYPHLHLQTTTIAPTIEEEVTTVSIEKDIVTDKDLSENVIIPHESVTTASPNMEETEPDRGMNTIPSETTEESSSESSLAQRTTTSLETKETEGTHSQDLEIKSTTSAEIATLSPESMTTKVDQSTITTEPSFRKEDDITVSTEKPKETEQTTVKSEFVDEGLIPTSSHDEKTDTSSKAPSIEEEFTTSIPEYVTEISDTTGLKETTVPTQDSIVTVKESESSHEQDGDLPSSTEKLMEVTPFHEENVDIQEEPSRIPGEGDCLLNGITYRNNSVVPSTNNCHTGCRCASSIIKCDPIICSPPPDYMDNCQSIYDSPDSCCPTYVCDHPRETVPPQSDNQMSGTEPPMPSPTIECRGDQCEISQPTKQPIEQFDLKPTSKPEIECGSEGCSDGTHKPDSGHTSGEQSEKCPGGKCEVQGCTNGECDLPQTEGQVSPAKPCEGEHCEKIDEVISESPQLCKNEEDCRPLEIPVVSGAPCQGESCEKVDSHAVASPSEKPYLCKDNDDCKTQDIPDSDCSGDEPCRRKETTTTDEKIPSTCEGTDCVHEQVTTVFESVDTSSTELPKIDQTPSKEITEMPGSADEEKVTEIPDSPINKPKDEKVPMEETDNYTTESQTGEGMTVSEKEKPVHKDDATDKPSTPEDVETESPAISDETDKNKPSDEAEITTKPATESLDVIEPGTTESAIAHEKDEEPVIMDSGTEKPALPSDDGEKEPVINDTDATPEPTMVEQGTESPTVATEVDTDKIATVDVDFTEKPFITEYYPDAKGETTITPSVVEEESSSKPATGERTTDAPAIVDQESTSEPVLVVDTDKPSFVDSNDKEKPDIIDTDSTKKPSEADEGTDKPITDEDQNKPATVITEETYVEATDKPAYSPDVTKEESTVKPLSTDEQETAIDSEKEITEQPTLTTETDTKIPEVVDKESDKEPPIRSGDDKDTDEGVEKPTPTEDEKMKPEVVGQEETEKPSTVHEGGEDKPSQENDGQKETTEIGQDNTEKPILVDVVEPEKPLEVEDGHKEKPDVVLKDKTESPYGNEEKSSEMPQTSVDEGTEEPITVEKDTERPTFADNDDKQKPTLAPEDEKDTSGIIEPDMKEKPAIEKESTELPATVTEAEVETETEKLNLREDDFEKPTTINTSIKPSLPDEESTLIPDVLEDKNTVKPTIFDEGTEEPTISIKEDTTEGGDIENETTELPSTSEEVDTKKPMIIDEDAELKPGTTVDISTEEPITDEKTTYKPSITKEEDMIKPTVSEGTQLDKESSDKPYVPQEETTATPTVTKEAATDKPVLIDEEGNVKPVDEEQTEHPDLVKETQDKPKDEDKPAIIDEEVTDRPAVNEGQTTESIYGEEGSGSEAPIIPQTSEPNKEEEAIHEIEKSTKTPSYDTQTTLIGDKEHELSTDSNIIGTEAPEKKVTQYEDNETNEPTDKLTSSDHSLGSATETPLSEQELTTKAFNVPEQEKVTINDQGTEGTTHKYDIIDTKGDEASTTRKDLIEDEVSSSTKDPQLYETPVSVEKTTETAPIIEDASVATEMAGIESPTTSPPDDVQPEKPKQPSTTEMEEESTTKLYDEGTVKPIPESHVTETSSTAPEYSTSAEVTEVSKVKDEDEDKDKTEPELPEEHSMKPERFSTQLPIESIKTDYPEVHSSEKDTTTDSPLSSVTEPERRYTEVEDPSVTGPKEITTGYPEHATEPQVSSVTEKIHESTDIDEVSSEKPLSTDSDGSEEPEKITESEKPATETPEMGHHTSEIDIKKPLDEFESLTTEIPTAIVTETQDISNISPEKDVTISEEKTTVTTDISDHTEKETIPVEEYTEKQESSSEVPHRHTTEAQEIESYTTESSETSAPETSTQSEKHVTTETLAKATDVPNVSEKEEVTVTEEPEVINTEPQDLDKKEQVITEKQEQPTELPTPIEDERTEASDGKVTTDVPLSLVTEHKDSLGEPTTESNLPKEQSSKQPDLLTTQSEELHKEPEHYDGQKEIKTERPVEVTESVEVTTKIQEDRITEVSQEALPEAQDTKTTLRESHPVTEGITKIEGTKPTEPTFAQTGFSETTPYLIELEEHTHKIQEEITTVSQTEDHTDKPVEESSSSSPSEEDIPTSPSPSEDDTPKVEKQPSTVLPLEEKYTTVADVVTEQDLITRISDEGFETATKPADTTTKASEEVSPVDISEKVPDSIPVKETTLGETDNESHTTAVETESTSAPVQVSEESTPTAVTESSKEPVSESDIAVATEKEIISTEKPEHPIVSHETTTSEEEFIFSTSKATTERQEEDVITPASVDKFEKPSEKPSQATDIPPSSTTTEISKPSAADLQPTDEIPVPDEFPPSGTSGYGEPDYVEEDQAFGPGTCRYGGKVYVSAQQIPRDDPCDFCFCFRSDIICLQQSCPPPIHGCHEEPIQGFCCPRYECPVSMATTVNVTTTTTTTTTTLPPHFPTHSYKGAAHRRGCQIKGHTYKVGEVVRSSSGPCLHCTCGGDGQMKCDPKACTPEPMLRQMIAAAVSAKRRR